MRPDSESIESLMQAALGELKETESREEIQIRGASQDVENDAILDPTDTGRDSDAADVRELYDLASEAMSQLMSGDFLHDSLDALEAEYRTWLSKIPESELAKYEGKLYIFSKLKEDITRSDPSKLTLSLLDELPTDFVCSLDVEKANGDPKDLCKTM